MARSTTPPYSTSQGLSPRSSNGVQTQSYLKHSFQSEVQLYEKVILHHLTRITVCLECLVWILSEVTLSGQSSELSLIICNAFPNCLLPAEELKMQCNIHCLRHKCVLRVGISSTSSVLGLETTWTLCISSLWHAVTCTCTWRSWNSSRPTKDLIDVSL